MEQTLQGQAITAKRRLTYQKALWKRKVKKACKEVDILLRKGRIGELISMGDLWEVAHILNDLGSLSLPLAERAAELKMTASVKQDLCFVSQLIQVHVEALVTLAQRLDMPTRTFPTFESPLEPVTAAASPSKKTLDEILGGPGAED